MRTKNLTYITVALTHKNANRLGVTQRVTERTILGISVRKKRKHTAGTKDVIERISKVKWSWAGQVKRDNENKWISNITFVDPGKQPQDEEDPE